jgi:hypothetical protein
MHKTQTNRTAAPLIGLLLLGVVAVVVAACGSTDDPVGAQPQGQGTRPLATSDVPSTTPAPTAASTAPVTTEACGSQCPVTDEQQRAVDAFFEAYNGDDWEAVLATISEPDPSWRLSPMLTQDVEQMHADFVFSAAMSETWSPIKCVNQYELVVCRVEMEDALIRAFAPLGLPPSVCSLSFAVDGDGVVPERYDLLSGCHNLYDGVMHAFGSWFEANYPDEAPIQGFHYRGWNSNDETAGARAAARVDEFHAAAVALLGEDGNIANYRSAN